MRQTLGVIAVLGAILTAGAAPCRGAEAPSGAAPDARFELFAGGVFPLADVSYSQSYSFTEYVETGTFTAAFSTKKSAGFEAGLQFNLNHRLGIALAGISVPRDASGEWQLAAPHPLYYGQMRTAEATTSGLSYKETSAHLDLVVRGASAHFGVSGFAGVSIVSVEADLLGTPRYSQSYPFDEITANAAPVSKVRDKPVGFNGGVNLDFKFSRAIGVRVQGRYVAAKAKLKTPQDETVSIDAGGFHVSAGLRLGF